MREISLAILDIAQNAIDANATLIRVEVTKTKDFIAFEIVDNGVGMSGELLARAKERGFSTKGSAGFGLALLEEETAIAGGDMKIISQKDVGTVVSARYMRDKAEMGNLGATFVALVDEGFDTVLSIDTCGIKRSYDTRELKSSSRVADLQSGGVLRLIREDINKNN